ncbi:MAG: class I SAM-dependent methyltransferase [Chitinivibrionia bacterium]|nr:class I SAM-dependent methyltransferase [Chitinivibrionia bacterium]
MGIVNPYFPQETCLKLAAIANANVFVETGTYFGGTTKWAAQHFKKIHTIELSQDLYNKTKDELISKGNITPYLGDSRNILPEILKKENTNIVFWLDGHFSGIGGGLLTAGKENPCPLLDELDAILSRDNDDIIIIDDARMYTGKENGYPCVVEIYRKIEEKSKDKKSLQICDDQIYIVPQKNEYLEILLDYVLLRDILLWNLYKKHLPKNKKSIKSKIRDLPAKILKKYKTSTSY